MAEIYPRLDVVGVSIRFNELLAVGDGALSEVVVDEHRLETRPGSGGQRISESRLHEFRRGVEGVAEAFGYPRRLASKSEFDADLGSWLAWDWGMPKSEGLHSGVWGFLCLCVVPHVVRWRFPGSALEAPGVLERFRGGNRNMLQRVWIRALKLDDPANEVRNALVRSLPEDTLVQIFERPGLSADPAVARAIANAAHRAQADGAGGENEKLHREAIKLLRARAAVRVLSVLEPEELHRLLETCWSEARRALRVEQPAAESKGRGSAAVDVRDLLNLIPVDDHRGAGGAFWVYLPWQVEVRGWDWARRRNGRAGLFTKRKTEGPALLDELALDLLQAMSEDQLGSLRESSLRGSP